MTEGNALPTEARTALITGASRGIGRGIATSLASDGYAVGLNFESNEQAAREAGAAVESAGGSAILLRADTSDASAVSAMVGRAIEELGHLDVVVLNAGICPFQPFLELTEEAWTRTLAVNLTGAFLVAQAAARDMVERGRGGRIIFISSISGLVGGAEQAHYCATKAGMLGLMRSMAIVLGPHGITCNAIMPGPVATDINRDDLEQPGKVEYFERRIPVGRIGRPADVGDVVKLLARDGSAYINGAEIVVDGGLLVNLQ
jgi:L-rhamnose 1-dehydrogenase